MRGLARLLAAIALIAHCVWAGGATRAGELAQTGWEAFKAGRIEEAKRAFLEAARLEPANAFYAVCLGQIYLNSGSPKLAIPQLRKALHVFPRDFDVLYTLAQAYQNTDDDLNALKLLQGSQPPEPLRLAWRFSEGFSLFRLGRTETAESVFRQLLGNESVRAPATFFIANCFFARSQFEQALSYYKSAISLGDVPGNKALNSYYYNLGLTLYQLHRFREAADAFRHSIERFSKDPLPWLFLGRCETELGNFSQAIEAYESAIKAGPEFRLAYYQLARLHAEHGEKNRAEQLFEKVAELRMQELLQEQDLARRLKLTPR